MRKNITIFDVLVVYSDGIATSAASKEKNLLFPFSSSSRRKNYNDAYAYFLKICKKNNLNAAFTTTKDLTTSGVFKSYWIFKKNKWIKMNELCSAIQVFDKFSPINNKQKRRRRLLFSNAAILPFNPPEVFSLFFDKQKTFDKFSNFAIPSVTIEKNFIKHIDTARNKLSKILETHPNRDDFSDDIIVKDRYGAGGNSIYKMKTAKISSEVAITLEADRKKSFIIQPFIHFNKGHKLGKFKGYTDIRLVFMGSQIIQSYLRKPKKNGYKYNEHQGGTLEYISKREIPRKVIIVADKIVNSIGNTNSLYALDFIISNKGNVYLMEGNSGPGIDWNLSLKKMNDMQKNLFAKLLMK